MTDDRLQKLETLLAHQERQIQDLSDMINLHRKEIDILKARLDKTQTKIIDMEMEGRSGEQGESLTVTQQAARDKPPHY